MSRDFSGTSQYITGSAPAISGDMTMACWVNLDSWAYPANDGDLAGIFGKALWGGNADGDVRLIIQGPAAEAEEVLEFDIQTSAGDFAAKYDVDPAPAAGWHHIAGRHNEAANTAALFFDGASVATAAPTGTLSSNAHNIAIGGYTGNEAATELNGRVAECAIWNRALSNDELAALANGADATTISGLIYHMRLKGATTEPEDIGALHGTVTGATVADHPPRLAPPQVKVSKDLLAGAAPPPPPAGASGSLLLLGVG